MLWHYQNKIKINNNNYYRINDEISLNTTIKMFHLQQFANRFMKLDPEFWYVIAAFIVACMIWASSPVFFLRDDILGKSVMVAGIIAMTLYHRIAGIIALILVIALLNRTPIKEGLTFATPTPAPISFKSPDEFRQKYCLKGLPDDPTHSGKLELSYMLSPAFFTMDASGNPTLTKEQMDAFMSMNPTSFEKCTPLTTTNGAKEYQTIHNLCDPACNWTMKANPSPPTTAPTAMPTTDPAIPSLPPNDDTTTTEGFNLMSALRPPLRTVRHIITDGVSNVKSVANRVKRQF